MQLQQKTPLFWWLPPYTPSSLLPSPNNCRRTGMLNDTSTSFLWTVLTKKNPSYTDFSLDMDQELYWVLSHLCSYPEPGALVWALTEPGSMMRRGGGGEEWGGESNFPFLITSQKKEMPVREAAVLSQIHTKRLRPGREARGPSRAG